MPELQPCSSTLCVWDFKTKPFDERRKIVKDMVLCFNWSGYSAKECSTTKRCQVYYKTQCLATRESDSNIVAAVTTKHSQQVTIQMKSTRVTKFLLQVVHLVVLQTANFQVLNKPAQAVSCALLDSRSQIDLKANACRVKLGIAMLNSDSSFTVAGTRQISMNSKTKLQFNARYKIMATPAIVVKGRLTLPLPSM